MWVRGGAEPPQSLSSVHDALVEETCMSVRRGLLALMVCLGFALGFAMVGCSSSNGLDSVRVSPASQSIAVGQTAQFTATGTFGNASHSTVKDITGTVTWSST